MYNFRNIMYSPYLLEHNYIHNAVVFENLIVTELVEYPTVPHHHFHKKKLQFPLFLPCLHIKNFLQCYMQLISVLGMIYNIQFLQRRVIELG